MMADDLAATPLDAAEFAAFMARFEPFEPAPRLAVAVSGGADSMALALLADRWARARGGATTALTVDHRLRAEGAAEAAQAGAWLAARGIEHCILVRDAPPLTHNVQAAARAARYGLLEHRCATTGVLHLLTAHHREDQAETLLLRLARGSGVDGLAGMAPVVELEACRLLRPLLGVGRSRLVATLQAAGQAWIEDPSNDDRAFARVRLRQGMTTLAEAGLSATRLAQTAARLARARIALEEGVAALLARAALIHPAGFVRLDPVALISAPEEIGLRALSALLATVGGADYPPRLERLERLYSQLKQGLAGGRTLCGCRILPRRGGVLICREPAAVAAPVRAIPGGTVAWDGRFRLRLPPEAPAGLVLGALGAAAVKAVARLPAPVRASIPALHDDKAVVAVPAVGYVREGMDGRWLMSGSLLLKPSRSLTGAGFTVV